MTSSTSPSPAEELPSIRVLGTRVHMLEIPRVVELMAHWLSEESHVYHHVINSGMHGVMAAHNDKTIGTIMNSVELFAPDGILMVLVARLRGFRLRKKQTGPGLLWEFSKVANEKGYKYFLYGDQEQTLCNLKARLKDVFPNLSIVGTYSPPFRPLTVEEDQDIVSTINDSAPDVLWVALGMPQQEIWIAEHRDKLNVPIAVGAGAAFKLLSGDLKRAPSWVQNTGFEWAWRLVYEPTRVWRRVMIDAPRFIYLVALEFAGLGKYGQKQE